MFQIWLRFEQERGNVLLKDIEGEEKVGKFRYLRISDLSPAVYLLLYTQIAFYGQSRLAESDEYSTP
jgi:hypothetical protein